MNLLLIEPEEIEQEEEDVLLYRLPRIYSLRRGVLFKRVGAGSSRKVPTDIHKYRRTGTETL